MHLEIQWLVNAYYSTLSIPVRHPLLVKNFLTLSPRFNKVVSLPLQPPAFLFCISLWWCLWLLMKGPATSTSFLRCKVCSALAAGSGCVFLFICLFSFCHISNFFLPYAWSKASAFQCKQKAEWWAGQQVDVFNTRVFLSLVAGLTNAYSIILSYLLFHLKRHNDVWLSLITHQ